jgi:hypothetical protein
MLDYLYLLKYQGAAASSKLAEAFLVENIPEIQKSNLILISDIIFQ